MSPIAAIAGTRPEFLKLAPLLVELRARGVPVSLVHAGQHAPDGLGGSWSAHPAWPTPSQVLDWPGEATASAHQIAGVLAHLDPAAVIVQGDTASTLAGALAAAGRWPLVHLEAGFRCWDRAVPEERIRDQVDALADLLLAPSDLEAAFASAVARDGATIRVTGQTGYDAAVALAATGTATVRARPWALCTLHRAELLADPQRTRALHEACVIAAADLLLVTPAHPRLAATLGPPTRWADGRRPPIPPADLAATLAHAPPVAILTDSGGLAEEADLYGLPCVILRATTERWGCLRPGGSTVLLPPARATPDAIARAIATAQAGATRRGGGPGAYVGPGGASPSRLAADAILAFLGARP